MKSNSIRIIVIALIIILLVPACKPAANDSVKGQTIEVLLPPWAQISQEMLDEFTKETGVKVNLTIAEWDAIRDKISVAGAAGSQLADVAEFDWSWTGQFAQSGWFIPLEDVIDKDLLADLQNTAAFTANDHLYAIPYSNDFRISAYNTKMFSEAGITKPPATFDELKADLKLLKESGVDYPLGLFMAPNENTSTTWYLLTLAMGGELFDADGKPAFTDPDSGGYKALKFMAEMNKEGYVSPGAFTPDTSWDAKFIAGEIAFHISTGPAILPVANDVQQSAIAGNASLTLVPGITKPTASFGLAEGLGIMSTSKHQEAAKTFIEWWMRPQNLIAIQQELGLLPPRTSVLEGLLKENKLADGNIIIEQAKLIKPLFIKGAPTWYSQFSTEAAADINAALLGDVTIDEALNKLAARSMEIQAGQ